VRQVRPTARTCPHGMSLLFPRWPCGLLTQSGALGLAILEHVQELNLGLSTFVSVGNKAEVLGKRPASVLG
jgi:hypothetical protein